jgi:hypothetical protein
MLALEQQENLDKIKNLLRYAVKKIWKIERESIAVKGRILAIEKKLKDPTVPGENQS